MSSDKTMILGVIGVVLYLVGLVHDALGVYTSTNTSVGPVDMGMILVGVLLMFPSVLSKSRVSPGIGAFFLVGVIISLISIHDIVGLHVSVKTSVGRMDEAVWLLGVLLMMPYVFSLAAIPYGTEKK
ncbi:MAG: hypothetical protein V1703_01425 [Candidatus Altiarchaeota archaeon]